MATLGTPRNPLVIKDPIYINSIIETAAANTVSKYIYINLNRFRHGTSVICTANSVVGTYDVEVSNDPSPTNYNDLVSVNANAVPTVIHWAKHDVLSAQTANSVSNLAYPVQWIRVNCSNVTSGSVTIGIAQGY